jgi:hypothetical protein
MRVSAATTARNHFAPGAIPYRMRISSLQRAKAAEFNLCLTASVELDSEPFSRD